MTELTHEESAKNTISGVRMIEDVRIPMPDGVELAARVWLPQHAEPRPVPAVLEYIPYRKRDFTRVRDETMHPYMAAHGYAAVRVDLRGSGDSGGVLTDEYLQQELDDGVAVIEWLASQSWCDGNVGMMGISWGGFNALQVAAMQPPALKAIITVSSTDDRYADDVHYMGGCLLGDNLSWASVMFAFNSLPPDPEVVGEDWRSMWMQRLEGSGLWLDKWLRHQARDDYWKHGSICEDFSAIRCPVMAVSGWADGYTNSVFRLLKNLDVPRQGLVGPWSHKYPHEGVPGPAIDFQRQMVRWWDRWLKGERNGVEEAPMLRAWVQSSVRPTSRYRYRPGRWIAEDRWPSSRVSMQSMALLDGRLEEAGQVEPEPAESTVQSPLSVGFFAGKWCSYAAGPDQPHDQREEDGGALVFDTDPLESDLELLGAPRLELEFSCDRPNAMVAVRLSDVADDGNATRTTYGMLNLNHFQGHEDPQPLEPGKRYKVEVKFNDLGHVFPPGHRVRLSISTSYWPLAWPPPEPTKLTLHTDRCRLLLPVRRPPEEETEVDFGESQPQETVRVRPIRIGEHRWIVHRDLATDESVLEVIKDEGSFRLEDIDLEITDDTREWYSYQVDDFGSPRGEVETVRRLRREGWDIRTRTRTVLTADEEAFHLQAELDAYENKRRVYSRNWSRRIPRKWV